MVPYFNLNPNKTVVLFTFKESKANLVFKRLNLFYSIDSFCLVAMMSSADLFTQSGSAQQGLSTSNKSFPALMMTSPLSDFLSGFSLFF